MPLDPSHLYVSFSLEKLDSEKLQSQNTSKYLYSRLALLLSDSTHRQLGIRILWDSNLSALPSAANKTMGFRWDRKEILSRNAEIDRNAGCVETRRYQKKREAEMCEFKELQEVAGRGNSRYFYEKIWRESSEVIWIVSLWGKHNSSLLIGRRR